MAFVTRFLLLLSFTVAFAALGFLIRLSLPGRRWMGSFPDRMIEVLGLGLAGAMLGVVTISALHIPASRQSLLMMLGLLAAGLLVRLRLTSRWQEAPAFLGAGWKGDRVLFLSFLGLLLLARTLQITGILVPSWVDGYLHTELLERLALKGSVPPDQVYHSGFQAAALVIHHLWGLSPADSILLLGQWLSAMAGITPYILVRRFVRSGRITCLVMLVYSLVMLFPSFLVSWGRYPFLLGLVLLPLSMVSGRAWLRGGGRDQLFLVVLTAAGLLTAHYGSFLIWMSYMAGYLAWRYASRRPQRAMIFRLLLLLLPLLLLGVPKLLSLFAHQGLLQRMQAVTASGDMAASAASVFGMALEHDFILLLLLVTLILAGKAWKKRRFWLVVLWPAMQVGLIGLQYWLLGVSISSYANAVISLSLPVAILFGLGLQGLLADETAAPELRELARASGPIQWPGLLPLLALIPLGLYLSAKVIPSDTVLFHPEDQQAMAWIEKNTALDSVFMVRSFDWGGRLMPSDGGAWIHSLTGRETLYPAAVGDFRDVCGYIRSENVDYLYLGGSYDPEGFDYHLEDFAGIYRVAYQAQSVAILALDCGG